MNYLSIYNKIIDKALKEKRCKNNGIYFENHHILPKCQGGTNNKNNLVLLTAREHFICHKLLLFNYPNDKLIALAYHTMTYTMSDKRKLKLTSRDFERARIVAYNNSNGMNNQRYGVKYSEEFKLKLSKIALESYKSGKRLPRIGFKLSNEAKNKISIANKGKLKGVKKPEGHGLKVSLATKDKPKPWLRGKEVFNTRKSFSAVSPQGVTIVFTGGVEMKKLYNINPVLISRMLKGLRLMEDLNGWTNFKWV